MLKPKQDDGRGAQATGGGRVPGHRTRVLVVDPDQAAVAAVGAILQAQDWEVISAATGREALERSRLAGPDAVLTELSLPDMSGADLCRSLHARSESRSVPVIVLSKRAGLSERVESLRAGAADHLPKPPDAVELVTRLQAALDLQGQRAASVIAVLGGRGGVGASVLAANLAFVLRRQTRSNVTLVDADVAGGVIDALLNVQAARGVGHALLHLDDLEDRDFEALLVTHSSGLQVMLFHDPRLNAVAPESLRKIILTLRRRRDFVVIDTPPVLDDNTATILELADWVLLVLTPEITALRSARLLLRGAQDLGLPLERVVLVLNRFPQAGGLPRAAVEETLKLPVQMVLPDDSKVVTYSVNRGVTFVQGHARSRVARQVIALATSLLETARKP